MKNVFLFLICLLLSTSAFSQVGIGTATPNASAALDITSTTQGLLPPRMTAALRDAIATPAQGLMIYCTNCGTNGEPQLYNGAAWVNVVGGSTAAVILAVGDSHEGGKIAYIFVFGDPGYVAGEQHGLIAAPSDQSTSAPWGCRGTSISTSTAIGAGKQNTINIMSGCSTAGIAARLCGDLGLNGYTDWYLPSQDELSKLRSNSAAIGNFNETYYWSSTQNSQNDAKRLRRDSGAFNNQSKNSTYRFRPVRTF